MKARAPDFNPDTAHQKGNEKDLGALKRAEDPEIHHLTTATNDPVPLFFRIADADPHWRRYLFGRQGPGTRMEAMSWYWRFLLMIILIRQLNSRKSGLSTI
jgi:hypothetical protein